MNKKKDGELGNCVPVCGIAQETDLIELDFYWADVMDSRIVLPL